MNRSFSTTFTGWSFLAAVIMMWGGWMLIPVNVGPYVKAEDFEVVNNSRYLYVWSYRFYFFGVVFMVVALVALASLVSQSESRVMIWPGVAVVVGGAFSYALGTAFYYHHGYWGSLEVAGEPSQAVDAYISAIRLDTKYVTCFMRFGRLFSGLGLAILSLGLVKWSIIPRCLGWVGAVTGVAAIAVIMPSGANFAAYATVFHVQTLWLALTGLVILRQGLKLSA